MALVVLTVSAGENDGRMAERSGEAEGCGSGALGTGLGNPEVEAGWKSAGHEVGSVDVAKPLCKLFLFARLDLNAPVPFQIAYGPGGDVLRLSAFDKPGDGTVDLGVVFRFGEQGATKSQPCRVCLKEYPADGLSDSRNPRVHRIILFG